MTCTQLAAYVKVFSNVHITSRYQPNEYIFVFVFVFILFFFSFFFCFCFFFYFIFLFFSFILFYFFFYFSFLLLFSCFLSIVLLKTCLTRIARIFHKFQLPQREHTQTFLFLTISIGTSPSLEIYPSG